MTDTADRKRIKALIRAVDKAREFPANTCSASRHAHIIGVFLALGRKYPMLTDEPEDCGESILATVKALYEARTEPTQLTINIECGKNGLYYATSPDLRGLLVAKPTLAEVFADLPRAIAELQEWHSSERSAFSWKEPQP
jgi:hypothetical protein